jgi:hypothetical protein
VGGLSLALWRESLSSGVATPLLAPGVRPGINVVAPIQGGLTTFLRYQVAPAISRHATWVYLSLGLFGDASGGDLFVPAVGYVIERLGGDAAWYGDGRLAVGRLTAALESCLSDQARRVILCVDDGDVNPEFVCALLAVSLVGEKLRLLVGSHEPLAGPLAQRWLPLMSSNQVSTALGGAPGPGELQEAMRWSGGVPPLVRDLGTAMDEQPQVLTWLERSRAAAEALSASGEDNPYFRSVCDALTRADRDFLGEVVSRADLASSDYPGLRRLIRLGILRRDGFGQVEFVSKLVGNWMAHASHEDVVYLTQAGASVLTPLEAQTKLRAAIKSSKDDPDWLILDLVANRHFHAGRRVKLTRTEIKLLRRLIWTAATARDPERLTRRKVLEAMSPASQDLMQWAYDAKRSLAKKLGVDVIRTERGEGMGLRKYMQVVLVEKAAA